MKLLTTKQACEALGYKYPSGYFMQLLYKGKLPAIKVGRNWIITLKDLEKFAKKKGRNLTIN